MTAFGRLYRSELHRLTARRITRLFALLFLAFLVLFCVIAYFGAADPQVGDRTPWTAVDTKDAAQGWLAGSAVLGFVLGASAGGAEWAARTVQALLLWEPRRVRVIAAKVLALSTVTLVLALVAQLILLGLTMVILHRRGHPESLTGDLWRQIGEAEIRGMLFVVLAAVTAFSVSSLTRNTGAALGAAFAYIVILEQVLLAWKPVVAPYVLTANVAALLSGGIGIESDNHRIFISSGRGALVLCLYAGTLLAVATTLFTRRDVT
jgi:ABC-type transport system involved in multi-copper enzyme maturation permease subunit